MHADLDHVIALERALLEPAVRADPEAVAALLAPAFREVGASGRDLGSRRDRRLARRRFR